MENPIYAFMYVSSVITSREAKIVIFWDVRHSNLIDSYQNRIGLAISMFPKKNIWISSELPLPEWLEQLPSSFNPTVSVNFNLKTEMKYHSYNLLSVPDFWNIQYYNASHFLRKQTT
jgi:hypothetical protein